MKIKINYKNNLFIIIMDYVVYLLINTHNNRTYVGMSNNVQLRLRKHNGELVGGAKYTHNFKGDGEWIIYGMIKNLGKIQALSIEKRIQIKSHKVKGKTPLDRRKAAIDIILQDYEGLTFEKNDYTYS